MNAINNNTTTAQDARKTASPKPLGRDIYHIFTEKQSRWGIIFDKSVYHDPEGYALLSDNVVLIESKLDYKEEYSGKLIQEDGTESKNDMQLFSKYKDICRPAGGKYAVTPKEIEERIKGEELARKKRVICSILESDDVTDKEVKTLLKNNKDVRDDVNEQTKTQFVKLLLPAGESVYLYLRHIKRALKVAKTLSTDCISTANRIFQFTGESGRVIVAGCIVRPEDENSMNPLIIDLTDATPAPATPRDLPAPAPTKTTSKETTKGAHATTVQRQETSKQAPATPEKSEQEPMHAPQMLKKIIEEQKRLAAEGTNTIPLKTAVGMTTEVLTPKRAKELLGDNFDDSKTYVLVDGSEVVRFERPELSKTLYIDDESPEYKEYQRGNISAVELYRNDAMRLNDPARDLDTIKHSPTHLKVIDIKGDVLVFCEYGGHHGYRIATPDEVEIYKAAAAAASEAFTKRLDSYLKRYGKKIYVHSYWADR